MQRVDKDLALKIYTKASATPEVMKHLVIRLSCEINFILSFCYIVLFIIVFALNVDEFSPFILVQVGYTLDYLFLLKTILRTDAQGALDFALIMLRMEGGCPVDCNAITDLFLQVYLVLFLVSLMLGSLCSYIKCNLCSTDTSEKMCVYVRVRVRNWHRHLGLHLVYLNFQIITGVNVSVSVSCF